MVRGTVGTLLVLAAASVGLAACGGGDPAASGAPTSTKPADSAHSPTSTTAPAQQSTTTTAGAAPSSSTAAACTNGDIRATLSGASVNAATVSAQLVLTNATSASCALSAVPQVRGFGPAGAQLVDSPALVGSGVTLDTILGAGATASLQLTWVGTGPGSACGANHDATIGSFTVTVAPPAQPVTVASGDLAADVAGVCWVDAIEVTAAS